MATTLVARLAPFIAGYVLVLAVLGPIAAGHAHLLARALRAGQGYLPRGRSPAPGTEPEHTAPPAAPQHAEAER